MWHINLVENTVMISQECAMDLLALKSDQTYSWNEDLFGDEAWPTENFGEGGYLFFDSDAYEHMDYMHEPQLQEILLKHKVNGKIIFNSFEGDNRGQAWGYLFHDGVCTQVSGDATKISLNPI